MMPAHQETCDAVLSDLFGDDAPAGAGERVATGLAADSRRVTPGGLFLACAGDRSHGLDHLPEALRRGAGFVAWEPVEGRSAPDVAGAAICFPVPGLRQRAGGIAGRFFGEPSRSLDVVGLTGTNGKTTCTHLIAGALEAAGCPAGLIGTLGAGRVEALQDLGFTTPDAVEVHRALAGIRDEGGQAVAMEVSSHALDQARVAGVRFRLAAFTNLSRDHLDYHGTLERYAAAKLGLFQMPELGGAVVNGDDPLSERLLGSLPASVPSIVVGREAAGRGDRQLVTSTVASGPAGLTIEFSGSWGPLRLQSPLWGLFNAENLAVALAALLALETDPDDALAALGEMHAPAGRMEVFSSAGAGPRVVVDYAHTPDALAKALEALRAHCHGRLWCVFGCGGERDAGKRPEMGAVAERLADAVIVTDDNPRGEDGDAIVADVLAGMSTTPGLKRDRRGAIELAVSGAAAGDVVLVAGKGHEDYQLIGDERRDFSDREIVRDLLGAGS